VAAIAVAADTLSTADPSAPVAGVPGSPSTVATGSPTSTPTPTVKPLGVAVSLKPEVTGRRLRLQITVSGTALSPVTADGQALPADTAFADYSLGSEYSLGDGAGGGGSDGGTVTCTGAKRRVTGRTVHWVVDAPYTYRRPGTYTITYKIDFCGPKGQFTVTKATKVTVK
jgi:hypothetical protein